MKQDIEQALQAVVAALPGAEGMPIELTRPDEQFGDYATNIALQLAGRMHKNPREVAEDLAVKIRETLHDKAADVSVAGPGFLNIRLSDTTLTAAMDMQPAKTLEGKMYVMDYSDPNPLKPLHAGHLYTTIIGDAISRLLERGGAHVIRTNYGGDVGLHVARSMWGILKTLGGEYPEKLVDIPESERPAWLGTRYVEGTTASEDDNPQGAKAEVIALNKRVYQVQQDNDHESPFAQIYWTVRQWSYDYFQELYRQLQVKPFDRFIPESEVASLGMQVVKEHTRNAPENKTGQDVFVYASAGDETSQTIIFHGEDYGLHTRVFINRDGLPTYEAKDVGLSLTKWHDYHFDESIIITANEQEQYMAVVIAAIKLFEPTPAERTRHITHGMVKLQGGQKMSSRRGNIISAMDILDAARAAGQASGTHPSEETILAAVKYAFAKNRIGGDIIYDPQESITLEGNSGPYLQYAHARARSILARAGAGDLATRIESLQPGERSLVRKIAEYSEVVERATAELLPHYITTYLYELAQVFNSFYEHNRVIGDEREDVRLRLVARYADVLREGLGLLGITAPDHM